MLLASPAFANATIVDNTYEIPKLSDITISDPAKVKTSKLIKLQLFETMSAKTNYDRQSGHGAPDGDAPAHLSTSYIKTVSLNENMGIIIDDELDEKLLSVKKNADDKIYQEAVLDRTRSKINLAQLPADNAMYSSLLADQNLYLSTEGQAPLQVLTVSLDDILNLIPDVPAAYAAVASSEDNL